MSVWQSMRTCDVASGCCSSRQLGWLYRAGTRYESILLSTCEQNHLGAAPRRAAAQAGANTHCRATGWRRRRACQGGSKRCNARARSGKWRRGSACLLLPFAKRRPAHALQSYPPLHVVLHAARVASRHSASSSTHLLAARGSNEQGEPGRPTPAAAAQPAAPPAELLQEGGRLSQSQCSCNRAIARGAQSAPDRRARGPSSSKLDRKVQRVQRGDLR